MAVPETQPAEPAVATRGPGFAETRPPVFRRHPFLQVAVFLILAVLVTRVFVGEPSEMHYVNQWMVYAIAGIGFYLMFVVVGRFAFCQTFMMSTGGYMAAYFSRDHGFLVSLLVAVAVVVVVSGIFALVTARTESFLFAIATLALGQIGAIVYVHWNAFTGPHGLSSNIPYPKIFGTSLSSQTDLFWMFLPALLLCLLVTLLIERSAMGREAVATREMNVVARSTGVATLRVQYVLFVLGSAMGGLAGAMAAFWQGSMSTETFTIDLAIGLFLIPILGGIGSVWGTVLGSFIYVELANALSGVEKYSSLIYGLALLVMLVALPQGLLGLGHQAARKLLPARLGRRPVRTARSLLPRRARRVDR